MRSGSVRRFRVQALVSVALAPLSLLPAVAHAQESLPQGATVVQGRAEVSGSGATTTITQSTDRAVIDWQSFSVAQGRGVVFQQPGAGSATLNRVTGDTASTIAGAITGNGAVYLVNPNGISITSTGVVRTDGGFVASTLDITDQDFMAGRLAFTGGGAGAVGNAGRISAASGAFVALLGNAVSNSGVISVPLGRVGLGAGGRIALDLNGDGFMQVGLPSSGANVAMSGTIAASGGRVEMRAVALKDAVRNLVNLDGMQSASVATAGDGGLVLLGESRPAISVSGIVDTDNASGNGGSIVIHAGDGSVAARGTLSARATGPGDGGLIETSGGSVDFAGLTVDTRSAYGATGTWLIDPTDLTVDAAAASTIAASLATSNVTLQTNGDGTTSGPGTATPGNGDITIASPISWTSASTLSLLAYNNINLQAAITGASGGLTLTAGNNVSNAGAISAPAPINVGTFNLTNGVWTQNTATLPSFAATDFRLDPGKATFLRATGGTGDSATPYTLVDIYGVQGVASGALLAKSFLLAGDVDASGTVSWNGGQGFLPIATTSAGEYWYRIAFYSSETFLSGIAGFLGTFDGGGHSLSNLMVSRPIYAGLFGVSGGSVRNLTVSGSVGGSKYAGGVIGYLAGGSVSQVTSAATVSPLPGAVGSYMGGVVGFMSSASTVDRASASGTVSGELVGGLIGYINGGTVTNSFATGAVTTDSFGYGGGLVGYIRVGQVKTSYATGSVQGSSYVGGLVGASYQFGSSTIDQSYATGAVRATANYGIAGGLIGDSTSTISRSYATGSVTLTGSSGSAGGLLGLSHSSAISSSYATGAVSATLGGSSGNSSIFLGGVAGGLSGIAGGGSSPLPSSVYWDTFSTGQAASAPPSNSRPSGGTAVTSDPSQSGAANYAYNAAAYANLAASDWIFFNGQTRPFGAWEAAASGGSIVNSHQVQLIGANAASLAGSFTLANSINLAETGANTGTAATSAGMWSSRGFVPVGTDGAGAVWNGATFTNLGITGYSGTLNGAGYTLSNLTVNRAGSNNAGLFGWTTGTLKNVVITGANISGAVHSAGLTGYLYNGTIDGVTVGATVSGTLNVGGIVGLMYKSALNNSSVSGTVTGTQNVGGAVGFEQTSTISNTNSSAPTAAQFYAGGLVGYQLNGTAITNVSASGNVSADAGAGGLVGYASAAINPADASTTATITSAFATGNVNALNSAGGLVGLLSFGASVSQTFASGAVSGISSGGLIGYVQNGSVSYSYATGRVTKTSTGAENTAGGLIGGRNGGSVISSFWDTTTSGQTFSAGGTGYTTAQLQDYTTYPDLYSGWDFISIWLPPNQANQNGTTTPHYPRLRARPTP